MKRDRIIYASVLILMFAACFGVYQFYFKAKLTKYAQDKALLDSLTSTYSNLNSTFIDESPDTVVAQYKAVVESWKDAIGARLPYFNDSDWRDYTKPPEDGILQFWYGEETRKMTTALWEKAQKKYANQVYQAFPSDIQGMLGVAYAEQWQGYDITPKLVNDQLERLTYGISIFELLMDSNAKYIRQVSIYEPKPSGFIGSTVEYSRAGLSFGMEMKDLVEFIDKLREADKYYNIEGIKVSHPYILVKYEPLMQVEMFLARAKPVSAENMTAAAGATGLNASPFGSSTANPFARPVAPLAGPGGLSIDDEDGENVREPEPSGIGKLWRWFKRTVLVTN